MAEEAGLAVNMKGYEQALEEQKERSRAAGRKATTTGLKFEAEATSWLHKSGIPFTNDTFKYEEGTVGTIVSAILTTSGFVDAIDPQADGPIGVVLEATGFYAESGGQVREVLHSVLFVMPVCARQHVAEKMLSSTVGWRYRLSQHFHLHI